MEIAGFSLELLLFLFVVASVAGLLDTLAGGGGLLTLPALIMSGIPPLYALGTNKLQGSMGTATATIMMLRKRKVSWMQVKKLMLAAFIGSTFGTIAVQFIDPEILRLLVPAVLLLIAVYFVLSPHSMTAQSEPRLRENTYRRYVVPLIGGYDGMFGPGTGSFFALAGVSLRGHDLLESTAIAKTLNFSTNISSLAVFLLSGKIFWVAGLLMMAGQALGAWTGSHCLLRINPNYLRVLVVVICLSMLIRYFFGG